MSVRGDRPEANGYCSARRKRTDLVGLEEFDGALLARLAAVPKVG